jgi:hypothetical protein
MPRRSTSRWTLIRGVLLCLAAALAAVAPAQNNNDSEDDKNGGTPTVEFDIGSSNKSLLPERKLPPNEGPFGVPRTAEDFEERAVISSKETIRTENDVAYAQGRTKVEYNETVLEADKMIIDLISGDIQAEGNVVYTGPDDFVKARSGRFNLVKGEGVAYGVDGQTGVLFFKSVWDEKKKGPSFRQVTERESIFKGSQFTTCDFPKPMYYIEATEIIMMRHRRIYFRNPVVYIRGVPVFWLPWYSRNLAEGSPWSQELGFDSELGFFFRLGYRYVHKVEVPGWNVPQTTHTKNHGEANATLDYLSDRGNAVGLDYEYQFDYGRHRGLIQLYGIRDGSRDVRPAARVDRNPDPTPTPSPTDPIAPAEKPEEKDDSDKDDGERWIYRHQHNSKLTDNLYFQWNADWASDPDVYVDILDRFVTAETAKRGRLFDRRLRGSGSFQTKDWVTRLMFDRKERLGRDRYTDFTVPGEDDLEFDPDPNVDDGESFDEDGISSDRFGQVSENGHVRYATRLLKLMSSPLYYRFEANAFNSLDAGFNRLSTEDDARVRGVDFYGSLTHRFRLGPRTTWTNTLGAGAAFTEREDKTLIDEEIFNRSTNFKPDGVITPEVEQDFFLEPDPLALIPGTLRRKTDEALALQPNTRRIEGLRFKDPNTVVLGDSDTERSPDDVSKSYVFGDYTTRFNHRFTDFLEAFLRYQIRQGSGFSQGEFYESVGRKDGANDIHNFYSNRHWVEGGMFFFLRYPNLFSSIIAGSNLQGRDETYANERLRYVGFNTTYRNPSGEFQASFNTGFQKRQLYDSADPRTFDQGSLGTGLKLSYMPRHARHWARLTIQGDTKLEKDPQKRDSDEKRRFDEDETDIDVSPLVGRAFGPKYRVQVGGKYKTIYSDWDNFGVTILRDLHDAELGLFLGVENNDIESRNRDDEDDDIRTDEGDEQRETQYDYAIRISLRFKIAKDQPGLGNRSVTTLADLRQQPQYVE